MKNTKQTQIVDKIMDEILTATDYITRFKLIEQLNLFVRTVETDANTETLLKNSK